MTLEVFVEIAEVGGVHAARPVTVTVRNAGTAVELVPDLVGGLSAPLYVVRASDGAREPIEVTPEAGNERLNPDAALVRRDPPPVSLAPDDELACERDLLAMTGPLPAGRYELVVHLARGDRSAIASEPAPFVVEPLAIASAALASTGNARTDGRVTVAGLDAERAAWVLSRTIDETPAGFDVLASTRTSSVGSPPLASSGPFESTSESRWLFAATEERELEAHRQESDAFVAPRRIALEVSQGRVVAAHHASERRTPYLDGAITRYRVALPGRALVLGARDGRAALQGATLDPEGVTAVVPLPAIGAHAAAPLPSGLAFVATEERSARLLAWLWREGSSAIEPLPALDLERGRVLALDLVAEAGLSPEAAVVKALSGQKLPERGGIVAALVEADEPDGPSLALVRLHLGTSGLAVVRRTPIARPPGFTPVRAIAHPKTGEWVLGTRGDDVLALGPERVVLPLECRLDEPLVELVFPHGVERPWLLRLGPERGLVAEPLPLV